MPENVGESSTVHLNNCQMSWMALLHKGFQLAERGIRFLGSVRLWSKLFTQYQMLVCVLNIC